MKAFVPVVLFFAAAARAADVAITTAVYEEREHFRITTPAATYFYDRAGGGFSRLIDRDGVDWISFKKEPLQKVPASAAAGFRGIPNLIHGAGNPDAGAGHPGFDRCESTVVGADTIRTVSKSGVWAWSWRFAADRATLSIEQADPTRPYWFLYEGTVNGRWSPPTHYWGTNNGGPSRDQPDGGSQHFDRWRWVYFGDTSAPRVLLAVHRNADELSDTLWYMGSTAERLRAPDGMIVFGFGRAKNGPQLRGAGQMFTVGFVETHVTDAGSHARVAAVADGWLRQPTVAPRAAENPP